MPCQKTGKIKRKKKEWARTSYLYAFAVVFRDLTISLVFGYFLHDPQVSSEKEHFKSKIDLLSKFCQSCLQVTVYI